MSGSSDAIPLTTDAPSSDYLSSSNEFLPKLTSLDSASSEVIDEEGAIKSPRDIAAASDRRKWIKWAALIVVTIAVIIAIVMVAKTAIAAEERASLESGLLGNEYQ